jgi:AraC-like DNA-binding protein
MRINFSDYLSEKIAKDYSTITRLFSELEGGTIEKYIIAQKIERVKELLTYNDLSLSEIAYQMGYSSVQHLSNQFKKLVGKTPSQYKKQDMPGRKHLDSV